MNPPDSETFDDTTGATAIPESGPTGGDEPLATDQQNYLEGLLDNASSMPTPGNVSVIWDKITTFLTMIRQTQYDEAYMWLLNQISSQPEGASDSRGRQNSHIPLPASEEEPDDVPRPPVLLHKQQWPASQDSSKDNGDNGSEDDHQTSKKKKDTVTNFWDSNSVEPPKGYYHHLKLALNTIKVKQKYIQMIKAWLKSLLESLKVLPFPTLLREPVLLHKYVDLDKVHSIWNSWDIDEDTIHELSKLNITFGQSVALNPITTHGQWDIAWQLYSWAVKFAYPGQAHELDSYRS
jgi:hypothetical protein